MNNKGLLSMTLFIIISSLSLLKAAQSKRDLPFFSKITVSQGIRVVYTQEQQQKVWVVAKDCKVFDEVLTSVNNDVLEISLAANHSCTNQDAIIVYISAPLVEEVYTMNSASFIAKSIKGLCRLKIIQARDSYVKIDNLVVKDKIELIVSGNSRFDSKNLTTDNFDLVMRSKSRTDIKDIRIANDILIKSEGKSYASLSGEAHKIFINKSCCTSMDVRNLQYDEIRTSEINII